MRRRLFLAVGCGSVVLCFGHWFMDQWGNGIINVPSGDPEKWRVALVLGLTSLTTVLPGIGAGLIARTRGILAGALSAVAGSLIYGAYLLGWLVHSGNVHLSAHTWTYMFDFLGLYGLSLLVTCAAGGAAGQVLRSNNRVWTPPSSGDSSGS